MKFFYYLPLFALLFIGCDSNGQILRNHDTIIDIQLNPFTFLIDYNDTNYTRIVDGVILPVDYHFTKPIKAGEIQLISDTAEIHNLGIESIKPIMIIRTENLMIEDVIDSLLIRDSAYSNACYKLPSSIKLPLVINGRLLLSDDKENELSDLRINEIILIQYVTPSVAIDKYHTTLFGVIEITTH